MISHSVNRSLDEALHSIRIAILITDEPFFRVCSNWTWSRIEIGNLLVRVALWSCPRLMSWEIRINYGSVKRPEFPGVFPVLRWTGSPAYFEESLCYLVKLRYFQGLLCLSRGKTCFSRRISCLSHTIPVDFKDSPVYLVKSKIKMLSISHSTSVWRSRKVTIWRSALPSEL